MLSSDTELFRRSPPHHSLRRLREAQAQPGHKKSKAMRLPQKACVPDCARSALTFNRSDQAQHDPVRSLSVFFFLTRSCKT